MYHPPLPPIDYILEFCRTYSSRLQLYSSFTAVQQQYTVVSFETAPGGDPTFCRNMTPRGVLEGMQRRDTLLIYCCNYINQSTTYRFVYLFFIFFTSTKHVVYTKYEAQTDEVYIYERFVKGGCERTREKTPWGAFSFIITDTNALHGEGFSNRLSVISRQKLYRYKSRPESRVAPLSIGVFLNGAWYHRLTAYWCCMMIASFFGRVGFASRYLPVCLGTGGEKPVCIYIYLISSVRGSMCESKSFA